MLLVTVLVACNQEDVEETRKNTIENAQMDAREENLLRAAGGETMFIYDVSVDEQGGKLEVWLEKYEYGQLMDEIISSLGTEMFGNGQILVSIQEIPEMSKGIVTIAVTDESGSSSVKNVMEIPGMSSRVTSPFIKETTPLTEDMAIGQIIYSEENPISVKSSWGDLVNDPSSIANELKEHPVVYLMRCSFEEKPTKADIN